MRAREWVLFAADAPVLPGQTEVTTAIEPVCSLLQELSPEHRSIWRLRRVPATPQEANQISLQLTYHAQLMSRHLRTPGDENPSDSIPGLSHTQRRMYLQAHGSIDHADRDFREWLQQTELLRKKDEDPLTFARRVFLELRQSFRYRYELKQNRKASNVCRAKWSDCGGLANVFVATLRANNVPARALYGRWAKSSDPREKLSGAAYHQWHVKSEFFVEGLGWVPADLSSSIQHDHSAAGLRYFGHDTGDFLALHVDPDFEVNTIHFGRCEVDNLQVPAYWVYGGGTLDGAEIKEDWKVRRLP